MLYDRSQACPTLEDRNSLDAYLEVSSDPVSIVLDQSTSTLEDKFRETCYWVIRPERNLWVPNASKMTLWIDSIEGGFIFVL